MKLIEFKNTDTQRIYNDYINRSKRAIKILAPEDQEDCLMEINSYIYEYIQNNPQEQELTAMLNILERLGDPEITLKEVVATKKIDQAVRTFNIKHLMQALLLNLRNGVVYIILFLMVLFGVCFPVLIVLKLIYPEKTGLYIGEHTFFFGIATSKEGVSEVLGNWFIPVVILLSVLFYFIIIFLLKLVKTKKP
ncbi:MAG: DUF1700 domain-containing protein [Arcicella sp.]|jgi:uncharacterized membrane protein|nr:DUF1700 domain-containing protein [Arcicella sp.]